jgi:hypothetical protein
METLSQFLPLLLITVIIYLLYKREKRKKEKFQELERKLEELLSKDSQTENKIPDENSEISEVSKKLKHENLWKKSRIGLFIIIPIIGVIDIFDNDTSGSNMNLIPTIVNFFVTREVVKRIIKTDRVIKFPIMLSMGVSLIVFLIQILVGILFQMFILK